MLQSSKRLQNPVSCSSLVGELLIAGEPPKTVEDLDAQIARLRDQVSRLMQDLSRPADADLADRLVESVQQHIAAQDRLASADNQASNPAEDAELKAWAEQFDAKIDELTARQDAFLKYLDLHPRQA
jgi:tRNA A37 N6-isopentenylltransferase MiaA